MQNTERTNYLLAHVLDDKQVNILILGDTSDETKIAHQIKYALRSRGYMNIFCVDKEIKDINSISAEISLSIFCMNPNKLNKLLLTTKHKNLGMVLIQPGSANPDTILILNDNNIRFEQGCILQYFRYF